MALGAPQLAPQIADIVRAILANPDDAISDVLREAAAAVAVQQQRIEAAAVLVVKEATERAAALANEATTMRDHAEAELDDLAT